MIRKASDIYPSILKLSIEICNPENFDVKNVKGTADNDCKCKSWIEHWKKHSVSNKLNPECSVIACNSDSSSPIDGGHIKKVGVDDGSWFIIPLCRSHNLQHGKEFEIQIHPDDFVSACVSQTCGK